ncbi:MAG TPA: cation:proton antiporter, partial [Thermoanaerobaculia bacterium]
MDSYLTLERTLLILFADLAIIIGASRVFGWLFGKVGQPPVVGEILAGVILGPSLLGRLYPGAIQTMLTPQTSAVLSAMAQVGLVLLMLLIGLEFPFDRLRHAARVSALVAAAGIVVPFASAYALAGYLFRLAPSGAPELAFRLFFATAVSITAIPIMGRILIHTGLTRTRMGLTSITAAALDDVLGWILLGAVVTMVTHGKADWGTLSLSLAGVAVLGAAFWALGKYGLARLKIKRGASGGLTADLLTAVLVVVFATATATNALGVFSIFGGFLCGIAGSFNPDLRDGIRASIGDLVSVLLLPIFFVFSGLRTDMGSLGSDSRLWVALVLVILVSCASKFGATALVARWCGLPWKESLSIGLLMNTRALMALVVINIGADMGV